MRLQAGDHPVRHNQKVYVELSAKQRESLGFLKGEKPKKLGCGMTGCAYVSKNADAICKLTQDDSDARTAFFLMQQGSKPDWAIPIYGVYRVGKGLYAICTARGDDLPEEWSEPLEELFEWCDKNDIQDDEWDEVRNEILQEIVAQESKRGSTTDSVAVKRALELVHSAVTGFRTLGIDWADAKSDNWKMFNGRPVLIDFGLTRFTSKGEYPGILDLPAL